MSGSKSIAVVIPAFNEEAMVGKVISDLHKTLSKNDLNFEIIVVDDGSTDDTADQADRLEVHVISHILNIGQGGALATGLSYAQAHGFDIAITADADGQHDPDDVVEGIEFMMKSNIDLLIGSRLIKPDGMSRTKIIGNKGLSFITYLLFGVNVTDSQSGLRLFSKKALESLKWKTSGYEFASEMLWRAKQQDLKIKEYPIKAIYTDYSKSAGRGQSNWNGFNIVKYLVRRRILELLGE